MSPMGKKKCSYSVMKKKGLIAPALKKTLTTKPNEDGTETNTFQKTNRKGEVKKTVISLVGTDSYGDKVGLASIKSKPGKEDKNSGNKKALADLKKSINNTNIAQSSNG